ncbi:hypothetical protein KIPB_002477 [Kipferlia bialata]|uniref:FCH domain-containing protein n=1 Tax=Kipferlia bialata TaxID=797122 RepID=A0A9K3CQU5_9EUKA|nr:hypothetical protein KIPB_002477 [Kipferlia bialata]|eukprot:g2477.t1
MGDDLLLSPFAGLINDAKQIDTIPEASRQSAASAGGIDDDFNIAGGKAIKGKPSVHPADARSPQPSPQQPAAPVSRPVLDAALSHPTLVLDYFRRKKKELKVLIQYIEQIASIEDTYATKGRRALDSVVESDHISLSDTPWPELRQSLLGDTLARGEMASVLTDTVLPGLCAFLSEYKAGQQLCRDNVTELLKTLSSKTKEAGKARKAYRKLEASHSRHRKRGSGHLAQTQGEYNTALGAVKVANARYEAGARAAFRGMASLDAERETRVWHAVSAVLARRVSAGRKTGGGALEALRRLAQPRPGFDFSDLTHAGLPPGGIEGLDDAGVDTALLGSLLDEGTHGVSGIWPLTTDSTEGHGYGSGRDAQVSYPSATMVRPKAEVRSAEVDEPLADTSSFVTEGSREGQRPTVSVSRQAKTSVSDFFGGELPERTPSVPQDEAPKREREREKEVPARPSGSSKRERDRARAKPKGKADPPAEAIQTSLFKMEDETLQPLATPSPPMPGSLGFSIDASRGILSQETETVQSAAMTSHSLASLSARMGQNTHTPTPIQGPPSPSQSDTDSDDMYGVAAVDVSLNLSLGSGDTDEY